MPTIPKLCQFVLTSLFLGLGTIPVQAQAPQPARSPPLELQGGAVRQAEPVFKTEIKGTPGYPVTYRYLGEAPNTLEVPTTAPAGAESDKRPGRIEFLPSTFERKPTSLISVLLRLMVLLGIVVALIYGGWRLWHAK